MFVVYIMNLYIVQAMTERRKERRKMKKKILIEERKGVE